MTVEWKHCAIGDILELQRGYDITRSGQRDGAIPVVSSGGISSYHQEGMSTGPGVVIGRKGTLGKVFYLEGSYWPHDTTLWVRDFKGNLPKFVYYFFKTLDFGFLDVGSANPTLNRNHVHPLPIRWPDLGTQQAIVEVLCVLDDKIAANDRAACLVDELLAARFALISVGASEVRVSEVAELNPEIAIGHEGTLRYLDIAALGIGRFEWPQLTAWANAPGRARRRLRKGDVVWSTVRPNRRSHALVLDDNSSLIGSTGLAQMRATKVHWSYLYEATRRPCFGEYLEAETSGSAYPAIAPQRVGFAPIELMAEGDRRAFEELAAPLRLRAHSAVVESRVLSDLRDTLLPELMSGRLRVKDAEKSVEEVV